MNRFHRLSLLLLVLAISVGWSSKSSAQGTTGHVSSAEDFFQRAMTMMAAKDYAHACPLLAESFRLDPAGGTLQNLAICYESLGLWASAYGRFEQLRSLSSRATPPRRDRITLADEHLAIVRPRVSRVVLVVAKETADAGPTITIDDTSYLPAAWAAGIPLDPGEHALVVNAPTKRTYRKSITVTREGTSETVAVPRLDDLPAPPPTVERYRPDAGLRAPGIVALGVGGAALAAGGVLGIVAITTNHAADKKCANASGPDGDGSGRCYTGTDLLMAANEQRSSARTYANGANVLVPVGLVGIAVGTILLLRSGRESTRTVSGPHAVLVPSPGGAAVAGEF